MILSVCVGFKMRLFSFYHQLFIRLLYHDSPNMRHFLINQKNLLTSDKQEGNINIKIRGEGDGTKRVQ